MKLRSFEVSELHGYINSSVTFHDGITFLTGANGTGKTSILKLIENLLAPSISGLAQTRFSHARASIEISQNKSFDIVAENKDKLVVYFSDSKSEIFSFDSIDKNEWKILSEDQSKLSDYAERLQVKYSKHPIIERISSIPAPVILGTDREHRATDDIETDSWEGLLTSRSRELRHARRLMNANLTSTLSDTRQLVKQAFRIARKREQNASSSLARSIVASSFFYADSASLAAPLDFISEDKRREILDKREQITISLKESNLLDSEINSEIESFFSKIENIFSKLPDKMSPKFIDENPSLFSEWIFNRAQIDRLEKLISKIEEQNEKISNYYGTINKFLDLVNYFFKDSNKKVAIDPVGNIYFQIQGNQEARPIDQLSSGEKQILIIFSHALFNSFTSKSRVLIIDEPELSMHLGWQECFVEKILEGCGEMQVILATHSPEIIGEYFDCAAFLG